MCACVCVLCACTCVDEIALLGILTAPYMGKNCTEGMFVCFFKFFDQFTKKCEEREREREIDREREREIEKNPDRSLLQTQIRVTRR